MAGIVILLIVVCASCYTLFSGGDVDSRAGAVI